jgi:hypothetical protein
MHEPGFQILTWTAIIIATATFHCWAGICCSISRAGGTAGWLWNLRSEWTTGRSAYLDVPKLPSPSTIGKTGPRQMNIHLGTGGPEPSQAGQHPSGGTPSGETPAWTRPRSDPRVGTKEILSSDSDRPNPDYLALSAMPQLHDVMGAGAGRQTSGVWIPTGPALRTTRRGHHLPGTARIEAQGYSIRDGDYHPSSSASG